MTQKKTLYQNLGQYAHLNAQYAHQCIQRCSQYAVSPLKTASLANSASLLIKDETQRMGLGSFKPIGGIYAVAHCLLQLLKSQHQIHADFQSLLDGKYKTLSQQYTFICASAGNHGLGIAAGAKMFGSQAHVYLPTSSPQSFTQRLQQQGATVIQAGANYDAALTMAQEASKQASNLIYLPDTSTNLDEIGPKYVIEGYLSLGEELKAAFYQQQQWPTHIFLPAGVGGLAAAISYHVRSLWPEQAQIIVVEPKTAACLFASTQAQHCVSVTGKASNMHRLDCKTPSFPALQILQQSHVSYLQVSDQEALDAVSILNKQYHIKTSPSGAAAFAGLLQYADNLNKQSSALTFVTEGCFE